MTADPTAEARRTPVPDADIDRRLAALDLAARVRLCTGADTWHTHEAPEIGLAAMLLSDGPVGVRGAAWDERDPSANLPSATALAASFDPGLIERLGALLAGEARRKHAHVLLGPTINLHRTPLAGRHFECYSEDPLLTARLAAAYVRGVQAGGVAATPKHLVANDSETDRRAVDVVVDERTLHEVYLAPFEAAVRDAGAWSVMAAYNSLGGTTMTEHPLLDEVLRGAWGFDGLTMSDWYAARSCEPAARGGLDLVMPGPDGPWGDALVAAVEEGRVPAEAVEEKVRRLLRLAARVGALDEPAEDGRVRAPGPGSAPGPEPDAPEIRTALQSAAQRGFVLLRNEPVGGEPVLPLEVEALSRVAVLGPNADRGRRQGGGSATVRSPHVSRPLDAVRERLGAEVEVEHVIGARASQRLAPLGSAIATDPVDGQPGVRVRLLGEGDAVLVDEHRRRGDLTWWAGFEVDDVDDEAIRAVEVRATLRVPASGAWELGVSGVGSFVMDLDGERVVDERLAPPAGDDVERLVRPRDARVVRELTADRAIELRCRHEVAGEGAIVRLGAQPVVDEEAEIDEAARAAAEADVALIVVGTTEEVESEGFDRDTLALPGRQDELVARVAAANPNTVVVVNAGAPVLMPWLDDVAAVLIVWFPGQELGEALAEVLVGDEEPGGRLPTTWPADDASVLSPTPVGGRLEYSEGLHVGHRRWLRDGLTPAFWFGHGLGYTSWEHERVHVTDPAPDGTGGEVRVLVRNAGDRPGREVVQVYASRPDSAVERPVCWLVGFATALVPPGATREAVIEVPVCALRHYDPAAGGWAIEPGDVQLAVGRSVADLRLTATLTIPETASTRPSSQRP